MDYVESFRLRFQRIDREFTPDLALKKKKDIRKLVFDSSNQEKKDALNKVWEEMSK